MILPLTANATPGGWRKSRLPHSLYIVRNPEGIGNGKSPIAEWPHRAIHPDAYFQRFLHTIGFAFEQGRRLLRNRFLSRLWAHRRLSPGM